MESSLEQRYPIKFCYYLGKTASETLALKKAAYKDDALSRYQVFWWAVSSRTNGILFNTWSDLDALIVFFDKLGVVYKEFLPLVRTVNTVFTSPCAPA